MNLKKIFKDEALSLFIAPPSIEELSRRLHGRGDTSEEMIQKRLAKAEIEMADAPHFDYIIINDDLGTAKKALDELIKKREKRIKGKRHKIDNPKYINYSMGNPSTMSFRWNEIVHQVITDIRNGYGKK